MDFGKLPDISKVDFTLPEDPEGTQLFLKNLEADEDEKQHLYIGCTGWSMKEWVGSVYPLKTKPADFLHHYTRQFNTIEHNTTHYRIPDIDTVARWREESADDFRFCPKLPQIISHSNDLGMASNRITAFTDAIELLQEKIGVCFIQLPPRFGPNQMGVLESFFKNFPKHIPLALELRHEDWFIGNDQTGVFDLMRSNRICPVITDVAGRRDVLHMQVTGREVLVRFVGNDLHETDFERIDTWVERLKDWFNAGLTNVYFFCHEPDNIKAPELSIYLLEKAREHLNVETRGPTFFEESNNQLTLF